MNTKREYIYEDGTSVPHGHCVVPSMTTHKVEITISSTNELSVDTIRELINTKYKTVHISIEDVKVVCRRF